MSYIIIVDMDQPGNHRFVGIQSEDEVSLAEFSFDDAEELKTKHPLGVFDWILVGVKDDSDIVEYFINYF